MKKKPVRAMRKIRRRTTRSTYARSPSKKWVDGFLASESGAAVYVKMIIMNLRSIAYVMLVVLGTFYLRKFAVMDNNVFPLASAWVDENTYSSNKLASNDDFTFILSDTGMYGNRRGWRISTIDSSIFYMYRKYGDTVIQNGGLYCPWNLHMITAKIPKKLIEDFRAKLNAVSIFDLYSQYDSGVIDGRHEYLCLHRNQDVKKVWFDNYFPREFQELEAYLNNLVDELKLKESTSSTLRLSSDDFFSFLKADGYKRDVISRLAELYKKRKLNEEDDE